MRDQENTVTSLRVLDAHHQLDIIQLVLNPIPELSCLADVKGRNGLPEAASKNIHSGLVGDPVEGANGINLIQLRTVSEADRFIPLDVDLQSVPLVILLCRTRFSDCLIQTVQEHGPVTTRPGIRRVIDYGACSIAV